MNASTLLAVALAAVTSICGWLGLEVADPDVIVRGARVALAEPLRVLGVVEGSPASDAGLAAGMEILAIDGERWDGGSFLDNLVRLQTVEPGEELTLRLRHGEAERSARLRAAACDAAQKRERAALLASLARMEGAAWSRFHGHPAAFLASASGAERQALDQARREYEAAIRQVEDYLASDEVRRQVEEQLHQAQRQLAATLRDPEVRRQMDAAREAYEEARRRVGDSVTGDRAVRRAIEDAVRELERARDPAVSGRAGRDEMRRRFEEAVRAAAEARALQVDRAERDRDLAERYRQMALLMAGRGTDEEVLDRLMETVERQTERAAELLERRSDSGTLEEALAELRARLHDVQPGLAEDALEELQRELERSGGELDRSGGALESLDRLRAERTMEQARRALEAASRSRELRSQALLAAALQVEEVRRAAQVIGGARLELIRGDDGRDLDVDHGLRVLELEAGSPLAQAGVEVGDVLLSLDGRPLRDGGDLLEAVRARIEELRDDRQVTGTIELELQGAGGRRTVELPLDAPPRGSVGPV